MLEQLQTHQQILFDLTANYLKPLTSCYARLAYLADLRVPSSGDYVHEALASVYGPVPVNLTVAKCHEEVFERLLEMPLHSQKEELRRYLRSMSGTIHKNALICRENARTWVPPGSPSYLRELYCSNLDALVELLRDDTSTDQPSN